MTQKNQITWEEEGTWNRSIWNQIETLFTYYVGRNKGSGEKTPTRKSGCVTRKGFKNIIIQIIKAFIYVRTYIHNLKNKMVLKRERPCMRMKFYHILRSNYYA